MIKTILACLVCFILAGITYIIRRFYEYKNDLAPKKRKWRTRYIN